MNSKNMFPRLVFSFCISGWLCGWASASTQVGEMVVLESSGPNEPDPEFAAAKIFGRTLKTRMLFRHYFSTPSLATPTDEFDSKGSGGAWTPGRTMFFVDGRPVRYHIGARMLKPGTVIYYYTNRRIPYFISIHTHARPISGQLVRQTGNALVLRRLIGLKFESSGVVYTDQEVTLDSGARFFLNGKQSIADQCLTENRLIRVLDAQPLTISAFTDDALLSREDYANDLSGTRAGFIREANSGDFTIGSRQKNGWVDEKRVSDTGVLDGQFMFDKSSVLQPGNQAVAFSYRGSQDKSLFVIGRSKAMGLIDGEITSLNDKTVTVRVFPEMAERTFSLDSKTQYRLNGQETSEAGKLKPGMKVTVFEQRPQVVDAWTMPPVAVPEDQQVIVYGVDGKKSIVKEGRLPNRIEANLAKEREK